MTALGVIREIKFILVVLTVCAIAMIGYTALYPEIMFERNGIYLGGFLPAEE